MRIRRHFGSTGVLFMGVLVALATLGIVYGLWSKNLLINGTVQTGDLNADWGTIATNDPGETLDPCNPDLNPTGCPAPAKHVGSCEAIIGDPDGVYGDQIANVLITNAYPSYECTIHARIHNTGTIPFNVIGAAWNVPAPLELLGDCVATGWGQGADPRQVDPGQAGLLECTVHVMQEAEQSSPDNLVSYEFQLKVCVAQWNEEASFLECINSPQHEGPPFTLGCQGAVNDICVDGDGIASAGPGAFSIQVGDAVLMAGSGGNPAGLDLIEKVAPVDGLYSPGDDLMVEDPTGSGGSCPNAIRDADYDLGRDCVVLDPDASLIDQDPVTCDTGAGCGLWFKDDNGDGIYQEGEDLIVDVNGNGIFD